LHARFIALALLLVFGQIQAAGHHLVHPLSSSSCQVCALAHVPVAVAAAPQPVPPDPIEFREFRIQAFRSEPFVAIAASSERAPPRPGESR
jgi:hypothetical protein